jgi:hypothetical protein
MERRMGQEYIGDLYVPLNFFHPIELRDGLYADTSHACALLSSGVLVGHPDLSRLRL